MGGDYAPRAPIAGSLYALAQLGVEHEIELIGRQSVIEEALEGLVKGELSALTAHRNRLHIVDAPDVIEMTDKPSVAVRGKVNSSMVVGLKRVADGNAHGFVSAGNTGAQMAGSLFWLKLHAGLTRPAI